MTTWDLQFAKIDESEEPAAEPDDATNAPHLVDQSGAQGIRIVPRRGAI
jgi:hypothetical protein